MTLLELLAEWTARYHLTDCDRHELAMQVAYAVDGMKVHPPMRTDLAHRIGLFTFRDAVQRATEIAPAPSPVAAPPPERPRRQNRCGICRELGHRFERCPERLFRTR